MDPSPDSLAPLPAGTPQARRYALIAVAAVTLLGTVGSALSPWLLVRQPLLLLALSPDVRHIILVAAHADFLPVLAVAQPRRVLGLFSMYAVGYFYGPVATAWFEQRAPRFGGVLRWLERQFARFGAPLLVLFPSYTLGAIAGAARTRLPVFVPLMLLGQVAYITSSYYFGDAIRSWTLPLLRFLTEHLVASTAACVGLVLAQQLWSRWRSGRSGLDAD